MIKTGDVRDDTQSDFSDEPVKYMEKDGYYLAGEKDKEKLKKPVKLKLPPKKD